MARLVSSLRAQRRRHRCWRAPPVPSGDQRARCPRRAGRAGSAPLPTKPLRIITYNTEAHLDPPTAMEDLAVLMRRHP